MKVIHETTRVVLGMLGIVCLFVVWQMLTTIGPLAGVRGIPTASDALAESFALLGDSRFWVAIGQTVSMALVGLLLALVIGLAVGLLTGWSRIAFEALDPLVQFIRPLPTIVILPLVLLVLGPTPELAVTLAAFGSIWPILIQVQVGVRDVDPVAIDTARSMKLGWGRTQMSVVLPSALPYIATGVRISASAALLLAIAAGLLGGAPGLGRTLLLAQEAGLAALSFGIILWSGLLGLLLALGLAGAERALTRGRRALEDFA